MTLISPTAAGLYGDPTTLAGVVRAVSDLFDAAGDSTPIMMGRRYLTQATGREPRVLFVETRGAVAGPIEMGNAASVTHACDVHCRGAENGSDLDRFELAYLLADKVITALRRAATGRLEWGAYEDASPAGVDGLGAEIKFSFRYSRDVPLEPSVIAVTAAPDATDDVGLGGMESGERGIVDAIEVETDPQDEAVE